MNTLSWSEQVTCKDVLIASGNVRGLCEGILGVVFMGSLGNAMAVCELAKAFSELRHIGIEKEMDLGPVLPGD